MSSATIQVRLQTLLQAIAALDTADVTLGDWRVMDNGSSPWAIIYPGSWEIIDRPDDGARTLIRWTHYVDVVTFVYGDSYTDLTAIRDAVIDQLIAYPGLNNLDGVLFAEITGGDNVRYIYENPTSDYPLYQIVTFAHYTDEWVNYAGQGEF